MKKNLLTPAIGYTSRHRNKLPAPSVVLFIGPRVQSVTLQAGLLEEGSCGLGDVTLPVGIIRMAGEDAKDPPSLIDDRVGCTMEERKGEQERETEQRGTYTPSHSSSLHPMASAPSTV